MEVSAEAAEELLFDARRATEWRKLVLGKLEELYFSQALTALPQDVLAGFTLKDKLNYLHGVPVRVDHRAWIPSKPLINEELWTALKDLTDEISE